MDTEEVQQLSRSELLAVRDLLDRDKRATWLWSSMRVWALWIAAVIGGWAIGWEALGKLLRALIGKE